LPATHIFFASFLAQENPQDHEYLASCTLHVASCKLQASLALWPPYAVSFSGAVLTAMLLIMLSVIMPRLLLWHAPNADGNNGGNMPAPQLRAAFCCDCCSTESYLYYNCSYSYKILNCHRILRDSTKVFFRALCRLL